MGLLKRNLVANLAGTLWSGLLTLALVPIYVRLLGIEAFGLIAFQATLAAAMALFDAGLGVTTNRELARLSATPGAVAESRVVARSIETTYWGIALTVGAILLALTPLLASRWLNAQQIPISLSTQAMALAVAGIALQFPFTFYSAGLLGLQQHVKLNAILVTGTTIRAAGSIVLLTTISTDLRLLFAWHAVAGLLQTIAAAIALHRALPPGEGRFDAAVLRRAFRFSRGVALSGTLGFAAMQIDKLAVSKLLPLSTFGYYSIAGMIATAVGLAVTPVQSTVFPLFSQLVARNDTEGFSRAYHRATQTVAGILLPLAAVAILFAREIVFLWTRDANVAREARWVAVLLVTGVMLNALSHISHVLQLAHGWTAPAVVANALQLVAIVPLTLMAIQRYGAVGAAAVWAVLQASFLIISLSVTHSRTLRGEMRAWLLRDVGPPLCAVFAVALAGKALLGSVPRADVLALSIALIASGVFVAGALSTPVVREWLKERWRSRW